MYLHLTLPLPTFLACSRTPHPHPLALLAHATGRRLAFTRVNFFVNGKRCGFGSHTMAVSPHAWTHKFTEDGSKLLPAEPPKPQGKAKL